MRRQFLRIVQSPAALRTTVAVQRAATSVDHGSAQILKVHVVYHAREISGRVASERVVCPGRIVDVSRGYAPQLKNWINRDPSL